MGGNTSLALSARSDPIAFQFVPALRLNPLRRKLFFCGRWVQMNEGLGGQLWDYVSPVWAGKFLDDCCNQATRSRIDPSASSPGRN